MKVTAMELVPVSVPLRTRIEGSYYSHNQSFDFVILRLRTDQGITGLGEAGSNGAWGETQCMSMTILSELAPAVVGSNPFQIEVIHEKMSRLVKGHPLSKSAIDMALYDIIGKALGVPVSTLLGGCYRSSVAIHVSLGIKDIDLMEKEAYAYLDEGVRTLKIKVGREPKRDVEAVKRVRHVVGEDVRLMVDANQGYDTVQIAIDTIRRMEEFGPLIVEQPIAGWDIDGLAEIRHATRSLLLADESVWSAQDCLRIVERRAADAVHVYLQKAGGYRDAAKCVGIAEAGHIVCNVGGMGDLGVASAAALHLSSALKNIRPDIVPCGIAGPCRVADDIITTRLFIKDGCLEVPDGPGLGVELDEKKVEMYRVSL